MLCNVSLNTFIVMPLSTRSLIRTYWSVFSINGSCSRRHLSNSYIRPKYFITIPLFYVNSSPHIGHLYSALLADAAQRFQRLSGNNDILCVAGTDEHGLKIQQAADKVKLEPQEFCDKMYTEYRDLYKAFDVEFSHFIRTTSEDHVRTVHAFWKKLETNGHIYKGQYSGWYCVSDEAFLCDSQLKQVTASDGSKTRVSAESGHSVEWTEETNYKFRLSSFQFDLLYWLKDKRVVYPEKFHKQLLQWVNDSSLMQDLSVSRPATRVRWGLPLPHTSEQTVYVWLDALVSYLTAAGYPNHLSSWPPTRQILGKDILKFHGMYWPALLMGAGLEPPRCLLVHSHWTLDNEKISKSLGNVISPTVAAREFSVDGVRYFLLRGGFLHSDANYSSETVLRRLNKELDDTLNNLLNRCTARNVNPSQQFPAFNAEHYELYCKQDASNLVESLKGLPDLVGEYYSYFAYYKGADAILSCLREANKFFENNNPWMLSKNENRKDQLSCVLHVTMESLRICGIALQPIVPRIANALLDRLSIPKGERLWEHMRKLFMEESHTLPSRNIVIYKRIPEKKKFIKK